MFKVLVVEPDDVVFASLNAQVMRFMKTYGVSCHTKRMSTCVALDASAPLPDLAIIDLEANGGAGTAVAREIRELRPETLIILVASSARHVAVGYELEALGYLVRPVSYEALASAIGRARRAFGEAGRKPLAARSGGTLTIMDERETAYVQVRGHYLTYHHKGGSYLGGLRGTLADVERQVDQSQFARISHDCLINLAYVSEERADSVVMCDGCELPLSRTYRTSAKAALRSYYGS